MGLGNLATIAGPFSLWYFALDPIEGLHIAIDFSEKNIQSYCPWQSKQKPQQSTWKTRVFDKHCLLDNYMIKGSFHDAAYTKEQTLLYVHTKLFTNTLFCFKRGRYRNTKIGQKVPQKAIFW